MKEVINREGGRVQLAFSKTLVPFELVKTLLIESD